MKLSTKIGLGYGAVGGLMLVALLYVVSVARTLEVAVSGLAANQFNVTRLSLLLKQDLLDAGDFLQKSLVLGDQDYREELDAVLATAAERIEALSRLDRTPAERIEIGVLGQFWEAFLRSWDSAQRRGSSGSESSTAPAEQVTPILTNLEAVRRQLDVVIEVSQRVVAQRAASSRASAADARSVARATAVVAAVTIALIAWVIIRSIRRSVTELLSATGEVAQGRFDIRLDSSRGDELAELAANFNMMADRLATLDEMKMEFLSQVAHDLKAPLASIEETMRLLSDGLVGPVNEEQERLLALTRRSSQRLRRVVTNVLDLTTIEAGVMSFDFQDVDLVSMVSAVVAEYEGLARERNVELSVDFPAAEVMARADPLPLSRLLGNLLANAIEHSPAHGRVVVGLSSVRGSEIDRVAVLDRPTAGEYSMLEVADQGPGVPEQSRQKIFEKFYQTEPGSQSPRRRGSGLGLAIVKQVAEAHDGFVWVEPAPDGGSLFRLALPMPGSGGES